MISNTVKPEYRIIDTTGQGFNAATTSIIRPPVKMAA